MTIRHHPSDDMLAAFAAGMPDRGQHVAIATHLVACPRCRRWAQTMEQVGGAVLAGLPAAPMSDDALARVEARLDAAAAVADTRAVPAHARAQLTPPERRIPGSRRPDAARGGPDAIDDVPGLPPFVRRYPAGRWTWIAPRVQVRPIMLPEAGHTRIFLLKSGPGTRLLQHSHTGMEMTCVLSGAFSHAGGHFAPGDFDLGDETVDHQPVVDAGGECVCLIAMQGRLRLNGLLGRLMQPFVRL
jgi:putative transcriptional regulator